MHFWIDKRNVCGQRRLSHLWPPPPYMPKPRHTPMVTPVHRFQRIESMQFDNRRRSEGGRGRCNRTRRLGSVTRSTPDSEDENIRTYLADSVPQTAASGEEVCLTRLNGASPASRSSRRVSISDIDPSEVYDYTNTQQNFNLFHMGSVNWCVWAVFILVTMLLVPAHLYLKNFDYRGELLGIFFVIILLFLVCFSVSLFHTKTRAILLHRLNLEDDARIGCHEDAERGSPSRRRPLFPASALASNRRRSRQQAYPPVRVSMSTPNLIANGQSANFHPRDRVSRSHSQASRGIFNATADSYDQGDLRSEASPSREASRDPPPYHVAILLPAPTHNPTVRNCETPPPAYEIVQ